MKNQKPYFKNKLLIFSVLFTLLSCKSKNKDNYKLLQPPAVFSHKIPVDVNPKIQENLKNKGEIYQLNKAFNIFSWQAFIAINWPLDKKGKPMPNFNDIGTPTWLDWKESFQVYREDGKKPLPWGSERTFSGLKIDNKLLKDSDSRIILQKNTPTHLNNINVADEVDQAFSGKLFDQNGNVVVYEVLINKEEFDYIVDNKLYNINGQLEFSKKNPEANFPVGNFSKEELGAIEIKFAWKILTKNDFKERYYQDEGYILDAKTNEYIKVSLGLIGMHIAQKTPTAKQWVWSTFEHIDNLDQNTTEVNGKEVVIPPTLADPNCETCPVNIDVTDNNTTYSFKEGVHGNYWKLSGDSSKYYANSKIMKTQAKRMIDIPVRVQKINRKMQEYFRQEKSIWQYYQLIDTQYPLDQNAPPANYTQSGYHLPEAIKNKSGGDSNIAYLTNISMETFFQAGNQNAGGLIEGNVTSDYTIFGTESCLGCHSSAPIYKSYDESKDKLISGSQLSGDFSWLLGKAKWEEGVPKSVN